MNPRVTMKEFLESCPQWVAEFYEEMPAWKSINWMHSSDDDDEAASSDRQPANMLAGAEAASSDFERQAEVRESGGEKLPHPEDLHGICIDIDVPAMLVPSTQEGHHHLLIHETTTWENYLALLKAMEACGIVTEAYVKVCEARGSTFVRYPWIRKGSEREDAQLALSQWIDEPEPEPAKPSAKTQPDPF